MTRMLKSSLCNQSELESPAFRAWAARLAEPFKLHRKLWEYCYIAQALHERGKLVPGRRGLGFAVGREPLVAMFAGLGCEIVATDQSEERAREGGWVGTGQHASGLDALNERGLCDVDTFRRRVAFRNVDMNEIPRDLGGFDFVWSSCSFEHLGSLDLGKQFVIRAMDCLKPGGVAVHTTEYNVSSNVYTLDHNPDMVVFRRRDLAQLARRLQRDKHGIEFDFRSGGGFADHYVASPPYDHEPAVLKFAVSGCVATSIGLIVVKDGAGRVSKTYQKLRYRFGRIATGVLAHRREMRDVRPWRSRPGPSAHGVRAKPASTPGLHDAFRTP